VFSFQKQTNTPRENRKKIEKLKEKKIVGVHANNARKYWN
jgi:hypothetical protein